MATTNVNTDSDRLKTLQDKGLGDTRAALNLQNKIGGGSNTMTPSVSPTVVNKTTPVISETINVEPEPEVFIWGQPDTKVPTTSSWETIRTSPNTFADAATVTSSTDTSTRGYDQGNKSSIAGWGWTSTPRDSATSTQDTTNKVVNEAASQYEANKTLDRTQFETQKLSAEAYAMETDTELKRFELEKNKLATEEESRIKAKAANDAANLQVLQQKERAANEAAIAAAQAKAESAERDLQIANDVELQKSNVAFAKLGLNLSTAASTQAQQIYTTWVYNLSKLKTENAFKMANLQVEVAKVEFDHTTKINDIINKSSEDSYKIRKTLSDEVHLIKNSITSNRLERQQMMDSAIDSYQKAIYDNQNQVIEGIWKANDTLNKQIQGYYTTLKTKEAYNQEKIDTFVMNGSWYQMTPYKQNEYERSAWLPNWTISRKITGIIGSQIYKQAQELTWLKGITFGSWTYSLMITEAQALAENGTPLETAINQVVSKYINESPEYRNALAKQRKDATIKASSGNSSASYWTAQPKEVYVDGKLQVVQFIPWTKWNVWKYVNNDGTPVTWTISDVWENKDSSSNSSSWNYWSTQSKDFYVDDGKGGKVLVAWQYQPWKGSTLWRYLNSQWQDVTGRVVDVGEDTNDKKLSTWEAIRAALEAKAAAEAAKKAPTK